MKEKKNIWWVDVRILLSIGICVLVATILEKLGIKVAYGEAKMDVIQKATAAIACLLCVQDGFTTSKGAGWMRLKVTCMAALVACIIVPIDTWIHNVWISILLLLLGVWLTILACKWVKAPYMNCKIGAISYVLMAVTFSGEMRLMYSILRVVSTLFGVVVVLGVTWIFGRVSQRVSKLESNG